VLDDEQAAAGLEYPLPFSETIDTSGML